MLNQDKVLHFIVGAALAVLSIWAVIAAALLKEIYDLNPNNNRVADWNDFIATIVGGLFGLYVWEFLWIF